MKFAVNYISNKSHKYDGFELEGSLEDLLNEIITRSRDISEVYEVVTFENEEVYNL